MTTVVVGMTTVVVGMTAVVAVFSLLCCQYHPLPNFASMLHRDTMSLPCHMHMHTCTHAHMHTCTHAHVYTCTHAHMHTRTHAHMHTCTHAHVYSYFKQNQLFGLSCFEKIPVASVEERGARMKSVGILAVGYSDLHFHMDFLQRQVRY